MRKSIKSIGRVAAVNGFVSAVGLLSTTSTGFGQLTYFQECSGGVRIDFHGVELVGDLLADAWLL